MTGIKYILDTISKFDIDSKKQIFKNDATGYIWPSTMSINGIDCQILRMLIEFCIANDCWDHENQLGFFVTYGNLESLKILHDVGNITVDSEYKGLLALDHACSSYSNKLQFLLDNYNYTIPQIEKALKRATFNSQKHLLNQKLEELRKIEECPVSPNIDTIVIQNDSVMVTKGPTGRLKHWILKDS